MASKTVALDVEAYELLRRQKRSEESFSDTVKRLARPRRPISSFAGIWSDLSAAEVRSLEEAYRALHDAEQRRTERMRRAWGGR